MPATLPALRITSTLIAQPLCQGTTSQLAETISFVTGHGFSRAANAAKINRALAPEGMHLQ